MYYLSNLQADATKNLNFRQVVFTGAHLQVVLMCLKPNEDIGLEVHETLDQFFSVEQGYGKAIIDTRELILEPGVGFVIPAGAKHNIINTSATADLKMYTIYAPANHPANTIHRTKQDAEAAEKVS